MGYGHPDQAPAAARATDRPLGEQAVRVVPLPVAEGKGISSRISEPVVSCSTVFMDPIPTPPRQPRTANVSRFTPPERVQKISIQQRHLTHAIRGRAFA